MDDTTKQIYADLVASTQQSMQTASLEIQQIRRRISLHEFETGTEHDTLVTRVQYLDKKVRRLSVVLLSYQKIQNKAL